MRFPRSGSSLLIMLIAGAALGSTAVAQAPNGTAGAALLNAPAFSPPHVLHRPSHVLHRPSHVLPHQPDVLHRLTDAIHVDGYIHESAWQRIAPLPMTMYEPTFEGELTERTDIRIAYDDDYLYVSGALYDSDPSGIRANSLYRDRTTGDDRLGLFVDTFNDNESGLHLWVNASGVRSDAAVSDDGGSFNSDWNTYWDAATVRNDDGWFAEMRIPFSSLGFQNREGRVVMGLVVYRDIARKNERHVYPALSPDRNIWTSSRAQDVVLDQVQAQEPIYVTPYALGGIGTRPALNDAQTMYRARNDLARDIGLDVKYNLTSDLTLDATINTDFAQVEADDQQVNLTRFSLFFPEKRQFFQERSGIFQFNTRNERLFHSRRVGIHQGAAIPILGGMRLVGRRGAWDVGILDMQTAARGDVPSENFGVARLRRRVFNPNSTAGAMLTSRIDGDGGYNVAYGLDGVFRVFKNEYLIVNWAQTFDDGLIEDDTFELSRAGLFQARWERRELDGWSYFSSLTWSGEDFLPDMGFIQRRNYTELAGLLHLNRFPGADSPFQRTMFVHLDGFSAFRNEDGTVESAGARYLPMVWMKDGSVLMLSGEVQYESLRSPVSFVNNSTVDSGDYLFGNIGSSYTTSSRNLYRVGLNADLGTFYDGRRMSAGIQPTWNPSPHFEISGSYFLTSIRFDDREQGFDAHLVGARINTALNTHASANAFVQYSSASRLATVNVRLRYNFREGSDLWIVYNEGLNADRDRLQPVLPLSRERTIMLKYTYTFDLRNR